MDNKGYRFLGTRLKGHRLRARLTQRELARRSDISEGEISRLESGKHTARFATIDQLAGALNISSDELIEWDEDLMIAV